MKLTSWQGVFWLLAGFSLIGLLLVQLISETNLSRFEGTILKSISRVGFVLRNKAFTRLLAIFSLVMMPSLAFVAASSYIFIDHFGLDEAGYGLYYMVDAAFRVIGPFAYLFMVRYFARHLIIRYGFLAIGITGLFIVAFGPIHPWGFTLAVLPLMLVGSMVRTPGTNLMLEQVDKDTGTASSLINSIGSVCGALGMMVISFDMGSKILVLAFMTLIVGVVLTVSWWNIKPAYFQRATGG